MQGRGKTKRFWEKELKSTANKQVKKRALWAPGLGRFSANLRRLVRLSAPSWFRIPGSISVSCLFSACPVIVKVLAAKEAWTFGLLKWITVPWFVNIFTWSGGEVGSGGRKQFKVSVKEDNTHSKHPFPTISGFQSDGLQITCLHHRFSFISFKKSKAYLKCCFFSSEPMKFNI